MEEHIDRKNCEKESIACGIMYRKKQLIDIGKFDEKLKYATKPVAGILFALWTP